MSSKAARRFAATYDLLHLLDSVPAETECPTGPTHTKADGAPPTATISHDSRDLVETSPTSPTCPTHSEGVGGAHSPGGSSPGALTTRRQDDVKRAPPERGEAVLAPTKPPIPQVLVDPWMAGVAELQYMLPLDGFSAGQWKLLQLGCASLFETHGARMRQLGWSPEDAFGIHPAAPGPAVHCYGLGIMLGEGKVVEMTERGARITLRGGVHQTFRRRSVIGAIPIWSVRRWE